MMIDHAELRIDETHGQHAIEESGTPACAAAIEVLRQKSQQPSGRSPENHGRPCRHGFHSPLISRVDEGPYQSRDRPIEGRWPDDL